MTALFGAGATTGARVLAALGVVAAAVAGPCVRAEEMIRFKNGHSLAVRSSAVEGEMVHVVLPNGSEASFPRSIVKLTETGVVAVPSSAPNVASSFSGRGPRGADLMGSRRAEAMAAAAMSGSSSSRRAIAEGFLSSNGGKTPQAVGFSHRGSDVMGVPTAGSERAPKVSLASRPRGGGGGSQEGAPGQGSGEPGTKPRTSGASLEMPDMTNPADRSHGHN